MKKILAMLLAVALVFSMAPAAFAAAADAEVRNLVTAQNNFAAALEEGTLTWNHVFNMNYRYYLAKEAGASDTDPDVKAYLDYCAGVTEIDLSGTRTAAYGVNLSYFQRMGGTAPVFPNLKVLNVSNAGIVDGGFGALEVMTSLEELNLSGNANFNNDEHGDDLGAIVSLSLKKLDISNTGVTRVAPITTIHNPVPDISGSLEELNISGLTAITDLDWMWDDSNPAAEAPSLPALKKLIARGLTLDSIEGLTEVALADGFAPTDVVWDLTGTDLNGAENGVNNIIQIADRFGSAKGFTAPQIDGAEFPESLTAAHRWMNVVKGKLDADGKGVSWDELITAVYYYNTAVEDIGKLTDSRFKTDCENALKEITDYYKGVTKLDMSGKDTSRYAISTGAFTPFTGLTSLNLSNTGISEVGGLANMPSLERLWLSGLKGIDETDFGAFANKPLKELHLDGTGTTKLASITTLTKDPIVTIYRTLETLDISDTAITDMNWLWNDSNKKDQKPSLSALKELTATGLDLTSIIGLVNIAEAAGFNPTGVKWDLGGGTLTMADADEAQAHVDTITGILGNGFTPPEIGAVAEAKIGDVNYESLADAVAAASSGDEIIVLKTPDIEGRMKVTVPCTLVPADSSVSLLLTSFIAKGSGSSHMMLSKDPKSGIITVKPVAFTDLDIGWNVEDAVYWALSIGVTTGASETTFEPKEVTTRGQMVSFLYRLAGAPEVDNVVTPFTDIEGGYYTEAVKWAYSKGIAYGMTETTFVPDGPLTRGQAVAFLYRCNTKLHGSCIMASGDRDFADNNVAWCRDAVVWAANTATPIAMGMAPDVFAPGQSATRAHMITFVYRYASEAGLLE